MVNKMPVKNVVVDRVTAPPMIPGAGALGGLFDKAVLGITAKIGVGFPDF